MIARPTGGLRYFVRVTSSPADIPTALITGASSGIGLAIAHHLAARGQRIVAVARREDRLADLAAQLNASHPVGTGQTRGDAPHTFIAADLSTPNAAPSLVAQLGERDLTISTLVNNAGFGNRGRFDRNDAARESALMQVNVVTLTDLCRLLTPGMVARGHGRVLNVASIAGFMTGPYMATYYASKAYVVSLSRALSRELRHTGVTVSVLCPGPTATDFFDAAIKDGHSAPSRDAPAAKAPRGMMSAAAVAEIGIRGMERGKPLIVPGLTNKLAVASTRVAPTALIARIAMRFNRSLKSESHGAGS